MTRQKEGKTKNDIAWEKLFDKYDILTKIENTGIFEIEASQINEFRESRLMAKIDHTSALPQLFKQNKLSILPISRSKYVIGKFQTHQDVKYDEQTKIIHMPWPAAIETIDYSDLYSEASALLCSYNAGIISDIIGEDVRFTIGGRMSTNTFDFTINHIREQASPYQIRVENSQCEIDAGFESENYLLLVEAKNFTVSDILIRQLYFPYRLWEGKISKQVVPLFLSYSNDIFTFFVFKFEELGNYNSLKLLEQRNYKIAPGQITLDDIAEIHSRANIKPEPRIPFPQADSFLRVVDLLGLLYEGDLTKDEITANYNFTVRQTDYYTNAGIYLGLIAKISGQNEITYTLSDEGKNLLKKPFKSKYLGLIKAIFEHEVFYRSFARVKETGNIPEKQEIVEIMQQCHIYGVASLDTIERRSQTVKKWLEWIIDQITE